MGYLAFVAGLSLAAKDPRQAINMIANPSVTETPKDKDGFADELAAGTTLLHGQYTIDSFLNAGGFGITYLARDSLGRKVVIKECFPSAFCRRSRAFVQPRSRAHQNDFRSIVRLFVQEAHNLAKLTHPHIVGVHQVFEDNDTAYMALDFVDGHDLLDVIEDNSRKLTPAQIKTILIALLDAVGCIHALGILHRDISPDNILLSNDLHPVLIDFGAAREAASKQSRVLSAMRVVKDGYSPQEFYIAGSDQTPSSDLYALAASFYHLISGQVPPNSQSRLAAIASGEADPYPKLAGRIAGYDPAFLAAIDKALAILPKDRLQSASDWLAMIDGQVPPAGKQAPAAAPAPAPAQAGRSRGPLMLAVAAVAGLALFGGGWLLNDQPAPLPIVAAAPDVLLPQAAVAAAPMPAAVAATAPAASDAPLPSNLPVAPDDLVMPDMAITVAAIAPATTAASNGLVSEWTLDLPFTATDPTSAQIAEIRADAPDGLRAGLVVTAVNGQPVSSINGIVPLVYGSSAQAGDLVTVPLRLETLDPATGETDRHDLNVDVLRRDYLGDAIVFETRFVDDVWRSTVRAAPPSDGGLQIGDVVVAYIPTGETISAPDSVLGILQSGQAAGVDAYTFAVERDGSRWMATIDAPKQN